MIANAETHADRRPCSIAVTGAKGGIGKSTLVLNLAIALRRWGNEVLVVDGDLGLANLDVLAGVVPDYTVEQLVRGEIELEQVLIVGPQGVRILPAASGVPDLSRLDDGMRDRLLDVLTRLSAGVDRVLIDTGAGLNDTSLTLQLAADRVLLVSTPEPTSLVDAYASLKVLWMSDPTKRVDLVVNAARDESEARRTHEKLANAARQFLGGELGWLGWVEQDATVGRAVRRQRAICDLFPDAPASRGFERLALRLDSDGPLPDVEADNYWQRLREDAGEVAH